MHMRPLFIMSLICAVMSLLAIFGLSVTTFVPTPDAEREDTADVYRRCPHFRLAWHRVLGSASGGAVLAATLVDPHSGRLQRCLLAGCFRFCDRMSMTTRSPNQITGPNAGGPRQFSVRTPLTARVGQFWR